MMGIKAQNIFLFFLGFFLLGTSVYGQVPSTHVIDENYGVGALNRSSFPPGFIFAAGSAAYQVEGAAHEDGKGPSIWDTFTHQHPEKIFDRNNGDVACDQYHRYKEDVKIMKDMGLDAYRFSISWPRIIPYGKISKGVNKKGLEYYHNLIDELRANGLEPFATLFHWDLPQALQDEYGGFVSPNIVEDYKAYADLCFREFGSKVKYWTTFNEPFSFSYFGYVKGTFAPGHCSAWQNLNCSGGDSATEPYLVTHHILLAHSAAVHLYKRKYQASQKGKIGITLVTHWFEPLSETKQHQFATQRALDFILGWFLHPVATGDYPHTMRTLVKNRLPQFTKEQSMLLKGSFDFLGMNYYTTYYAVYQRNLKSTRPNYDNDGLFIYTARRNGKLIGKEAGSDWLHIYPPGIRSLLLYVKEKYNNPMVFITENGYDDFTNGTTPVEQLLNDKTRLKYHHDHLAFVRLAIKEGANVKGYFAWSIMDDFEWDAGFTVGYGFNYIDRKNGLKRIPKLSAHWYKKFLLKS